MTDEMSIDYKTYKKRLLARILRLIFGLFLYSFGIVVTLRANIGYAPWQVFHDGLSRATGISIGAATVAAGVVICALALAMGERIGFGTILNMILVGVFVDFIMYINIIPNNDGQNGFSGMAAGVLILCAGLCIMAVASYFYIGAELGAGPRDSLMVAIKRRTRLPVGACRSAIELAALTAGWVLGGMVGVGTIISMLGIGFFIQITFKLLKFLPETVRHETIADTYNNFHMKK